MKDTEFNALCDLLRDIDNVRDSSQDSENCIAVAGNINAAGVEALRDVLKKEADAIDKRDYERVIGKRRRIRAGCW